MKKGNCFLMTGLIKLKIENFTVSSHDPKQSTNCGKQSELPNWLTGASHSEKRIFKN